MNSEKGIVYNCLKQYFGFEKFKGDQEQVVESILQGHDTFVLMPTGGGKSLCYQLPALIEDGTAVIVSPLISLMKNQVDAIRGLSEEDSVAHFMNSTLSRVELANVQDDVLEGKTKMLYVAPETLAKPANQDFFAKLDISFYAIDEAHCISEWGHDFRSEYRNIRPSINIILLKKNGISDECVQGYRGIRANVRSGLQQNKLTIDDFRLFVMAMSEDLLENSWGEFFECLSGEENSCGQLCVYTLESLKSMLDACSFPYHLSRCRSRADAVLNSLTKIRGILAKRPPIVALTSTATEKVGADIKKNLGMCDVVTFRSSFNRPNLYYEVRPKTKDVDKNIVKFITTRRNKSGIIYCLSRKEVERLAQVLNANNIKAAPYHAGLESHERSKT